MKIISTLFFLLILHTPYFSQTVSENTTTPEENMDKNKFEIVIENLALEPGAAVELELELDTNGSYTFKAGSTVIVPQDYTLCVKDLRTGNLFDLNSAEQHSFSVNRAMTKRFSLQLVPCESIALSCR